MGFQPFLVGDYRAGLQQNLDPWKLPGDAFQIAENMDMKDGILSRRLGYRRFASYEYLCSTIASISLPSGDQVVITTNGNHGLSNGDEVRFRSVAGTTELNGNRYTVTDATATTFDLLDTDGDNFTAYTSGGQITKVSTSAITGLMLYRDSNDDELLIAADTTYVGLWDSSNDEFDTLDISTVTLNAVSNANPAVVTTTAAHGLSTGDKVRLESSTGASDYDGFVCAITVTGGTTFSLDGVSGLSGAATTGVVHHLNVLSAAESDIFSYVNYRGSMFFVNGNDRLLKYDGTNLTRVVVDFTNATPTTNVLGTAQHVFLMKERLHLLSPSESGTEQKQRTRFSKPADPDTWHDQNSGGQGGFVDAPTGDPIVSHGAVDEDEIVFFRRSAWKVRYTGNAILPFRWERINVTRKSESKFGTTLFDKFVTSVGTTGILACNGVAVDRIDKAIPEFTIQFNADLIERFVAFKFEEAERVWFTYADNNEETINHALIYHFEDNGWTTHFFGHRIDVTGITQADPAVVTTDGAHGLEAGDRVQLEDVVGMTEVNDNTYVVASPTSTTFELAGVDSTGFTAYTSGGEVVIGHPVNVLGEFQATADDMTWSSTEYKWSELFRAWNAGRFQVGASIPLMGDTEGTIWELGFGGSDRSEVVGSTVTGDDFTSILRTKRLNPFVEQGANAEFGYIDILFSADSNADVDCTFYLDADPLPYQVDGQDIVTLSLARDHGADTRIWKRIYLGAAGSWHEVQLKTTGQEKYVDIHAMIFWMRPAGRLELHA